MKINNRYDIIEKLSESQNSIIYKVIDIRSNNIYVLKQLKNSDPRNILQFKREFSILQTFSHPHIVKVFDIGTFKMQKNSYCYYTMEFIEGISFDSYAKNHKYPKVISTFIDILNIIGFVHKKGYIHCDLKPNHLIVDKQGVVKLVDFGFVQYQKAIVSEEIGGTLRYIAPEVFKGEEPDIRTDIYSLGVILYESISGNKLFDYNKTYDIIDAVVNKIPPPIKDRNIPEYVKETTMKMLSKQRLSRFTSVNDILDIFNNKDKTNPEKEFIEKIFYSDFIGREKYINSALKLIQDISTTQGQILILEGVPGVGKTRFLKEIEHQLLLNRVNVNYIKLIEDEQFKFNWLLDLIEIMDVDVSRIRSMIIKGEINLSISGRYKFFNIIENAMNKIPFDKIHIFLIDDSDITDQIIIDFILYFADILEKKQFLFIFSTEKVLNTFNKLLSDQIYSNIGIFELNGLNKNETAGLIKNILGVTENTDEITNYIFEKTEGNPFFIEQILINIIDKKLLKRKGNMLNYNISEIEQISISKNFNTVMEKEFDKLSGKEKSILKITSIFGESIPINWLERILKYSESETIRMLDGYTLKRIFNITEDNKLYFLHRLTKTGVNILIDDKEKILIHRKILGFLKTLEQSYYILQMKAHHAFFAKSKNAKDYLVNLLDQSVKISDEDFIIKSFERLKELDEIDYIFEFDKHILDKVGDVYYYKGEFNEALSVYSIALDRINIQNDKTGIFRRIAMTYIALSDYKKAEKIFDNLLKGELETEKRFNVLIDSGWLYYTRKNYKEAKEIYRKALILSTRLENKVILGKLYYNLSTLHYMSDEFEESEYYGKKVIEIGLEYKNDYYLMAGYNMLAIICQKGRDYKTALEYYRKSLDIIEKTEDLQRRLNIFINLTKIHFYVGNIEKCNENYSESIIIAKKLGDKSNIALLYNLYGNILYKKGEWEQAIKYYNMSGKISLGNGEYIIYLESLLNISYIYLYQGKRNSICELIKKAQKIAINIKDKKEKISLIFMKGLISYVDCKFEIAYSNFSEVSDKSGKNDKIEMNISSLIYESECLLHLYRNDDALNSIEKANELMNKYALFHYRVECEYVKLLINKNKMSDDILKSHLNDLLNRTKENQRFLYARVLVKLSDIYFNEIQTVNGQDRILKSISLLKEARLIFKNMEAIKYLLDIDNKLLQSYERLKDLLSFSETGNKKYYDTISKFNILMNNLENPVEFKKALVSMDIRC
jgi:serine/threonine protein kinase/Tfp pilus assembly protein PilF